jgi:type III pantothenate kinase
MNIIIDAGNTRIKVAHFENEALKDLYYFQDLKKCYQHLQQHAAKSLILSNVGSWPFSSKSLPANTLSLSPQTPLPFTVCYQTPQTLGNDRRGLAAAAVQNYRGQPTLVIDAGTCLTFDFVNEKAQYLGGAIAPGLKMRGRALQTFTANLPQVTLTEAQTELIGPSTQASLKSGIVNGFTAEVEQTIYRYQQRYKNLITVLTGGDLETLGHLTKNGIFARPNFLLTGLNYILQHNE